MKKKKYKCACCGYYTFEENLLIMQDICPVCFWQNNASQNLDPTFRGGPNKVTLNEARKNFKLFGAKNEKSLKHVRKPLEDEKDGLDNWVLE